MKRTVPLLFLMAAALTATACGGGKTLDTAQVEKDLKQVASATGVEASAECPSESEFVDQKATSSEAAIRGIVAQSDKDPATVCDHVSEDALAQLGGDDCPTKAAESDDGKPTVVKSVALEGDSATLTTDDGSSTFERSEDGSWIVTAFG
jgi:hypothetical protein